MKLDLTKPVQTKDGQPVQIITTEGRGNYPVLGYIGNGVVSDSWMQDGRWNTYPSLKDLINAPEPKPAPVLIPLGPEDVPPGSVIRNQGNGWMAVLGATPNGVWHHVLAGCSFTYWESLKECGWEIWRPADTGWNPCHKEAQP